MKNKNNILIYTSKDGNVKVDVSLNNEELWLSQELMANLYETTKQNISYHINNIFNEKELNKNSVVKDFLTTASDGKKYKWYVNQAGGFGSRAKKSRSFVVYQNGTVSKAKKAKIEPGCEIVVPSKTTTAGEVIGQIGSVGTSMATLLTLLISVINLVK